jgi:putative lipoprotein
MRSIALALLVALPFAFGCKTDENQKAALEDPARVTGTLTYMQRIALPHDAVARISLSVMSRNGTPQSLINEATLEDLGPVPIPFEIYYRRDTIDPAKAYALEARIVADGKTWFESRQPVPVITNGLLREVQIFLDLPAH